jgi:hypothetical protein
LSASRCRVGVAAATGGSASGRSASRCLELGGWEARHVAFQASRHLLLPRPGILATRFLCVSASQPASRPTPSRPIHPSPRGIGAGTFALFLARRPTSVHGLFHKLLNGAYTFSTGHSSTLKAKAET